MGVVVVAGQQGQAAEAQLEALSLDAPAVERLTADLRASGVVDGLFVLDTCQRTEVYASGPDPAAAAAAVRRAWSAEAATDPEALEAGTVTRSGVDAAARLVAVVSGLRSVTTGEPQIVAQVRGALSRAQAADSLDPDLHSLVQFALAANKRVRPLIGAGSRGTPLAERGLRRASDHLGDLRGRCVLVVGAGDMGAEAAAEARRLGAVLALHTRTPERGERLLTRLGVQRPALTGLDDGLARADVVVSCTSSRTPLVDVGRARAAAARHGAPQVYVDLARPRDIPTAVGGLDGVVRIGLGDLGAHATRRGDLDAEAAVLAEAQTWVTSRVEAAAGPTLAALHRRAEDAVFAELRRAAERGRLDADGLEEVRLALRRMARRLVHPPSERARRLAAEGDLAAYEAALADVFGLDPTPAPAPVGRARGAAPSRVHSDSTS